MLTVLAARQSRFALLFAARQSCFALLFALLVGAWSSPAWAKRLREADVVQAILQADPQVSRAHAQARQARMQVELATPRWSPLAYYNLQHFGAGHTLEQEHELGAGANFVAPHQRASGHQARLQAELVRYRATRSIHARVMAGLRRFYRILALQEQLAVLAYWKEGLSALHRVVRARVNAGQSPGYEKLRIELELRHVDSEIRVVQAQQSAERGAFVGVLGIQAGDARFEGELLPDAAYLEKSLGLKGQPASLQTLMQGREGLARDLSKTRRGWLPSLSVNAGFRMRHTPHHQNWGFGLGLAGAFPSAKRVRSLRAVAQSSLDFMDAQIETARLDARTKARRFGLLCLAILQERTRYIAEIQALLEPLEAAIQAEYREGQRDVIALLTVLERSLESRRYRLELAQLARSAELDYRDAMGVFEK